MGRRARQVPARLSAKWRARSPPGTALRHQARAPAAPPTPARPTASAATSDPVPSSPSSLSRTQSAARRRNRFRAPGRDAGAAVDATRRPNADDAPRVEDACASSEAQGSFCPKGATLAAEGTTDAMGEDVQDGGDDEGKRRGEPRLSPCTSCPLGSGFFALMLFRREFGFAFCDRSEPAVSQL